MVQNKILLFGSIMILGFISSSCSSSRSDEEPPPRCWDTRKLRVEFGNTQFDLTADDNPRVFGSVHDHMLRPKYSINDIGPKLQMCQKVGDVPIKPSTVVVSPKKMRMGLNNAAVNSIVLHPRDTDVAEGRDSLDFHRSWRLVQTIEINEPHSVDFLYSDGQRNKILYRCTAMSSIMKTKNGLSCQSRTTATNFDLVVNFITTSEHIADYQQTVRDAYTTVMSWKTENQGGK